MKSIATFKMRPETWWYSVIMASMLLNIARTESDTCKLNNFKSEIDIIDLFGTSNLRSVKDLRKSLVNHMKLVENMISILDEWAFDEISNITESEKLNIDNYNLYVSQMNSIQINNTQLAQKLSEANDSDALNVIKTRSVELKTELDSLKSNLDEKTVKGLLLVDSYQESDNVVNKYESLCHVIELIIDKAIDKEQSIVANNFIEAIRQKNFESADSLLNQLTDYSRIVNQTYLPANYYTLLNFTDSVTSLPKRFHILKELNNEMRTNDGMTLNKLIALANKLSNRVINLSNDSDITQKALDLADHLKTNIRSLTVMQLVDVLEYDSIVKCDVKLFSKVFSLDSDLGLEICHQSYLRTGSNQNVTVKFQQFFKHLLEFNKSSPRTQLHLVQVIRNFFIKIGYMDLANRTFGSLNKNEISAIIKNIIFSKKIGLNLYPSAYLRSSSDKMNNSYLVFTNSDTTYVSYKSWVLHHVDGDVYKIRSYPLEDYYLDVDNDDKVLLNGETSLNNALWKLEIHDGNFCRIRNKGNNKYLYASESSVALTQHFDENKRLGFLWQIIDLSNR